MQNRIGPRWFQPLADLVKLLAKEEIVPAGVQPWPVHRSADRGPGCRSDCRPVCTHGRPETILQLPGRPDRGPLPAQYDDPVHRSGWRQHQRPLFAGRRHPRPDPAILL